METHEATVLLQEMSVYMRITWYFSSVVSAKQVISAG